MPYHVVTLPDVFFESKDKQTGESSKCKTIIIESQRSRLARCLINLPDQNVDIPEVNEVETAELDDGYLTFVTEADGLGYLSASADLAKRKRLKCSMCSYRTSFKRDANSHRDGYHRDKEEWMACVLSKESAAQTMKKYDESEAMKKKPRQEFQKAAVDNNSSFLKCCRKTRRRIA